MEEGDQNTTFFHRFVWSRKREKHYKIVGGWCWSGDKEVEKIEGKANNYFQEIYNPPIVQVNSNI